MSSTGLIYIHGGGWVMGDLDSHDKVCVDLSINCNMNVISIDYSLSPENPYPVALNQCFSIYLQYLSGSNLFKKLNLNNLLIAGDSAGGRLTASLILKIKKKNCHYQRDKSLFIHLPFQQILIHQLIKNFQMHQF